MVLLGVSAGRLAVTVLHQDHWIMAQILLAAGYSPPQIRALAEVRRRNDRAPLEETLESGRLTFVRYLYRTGRLHEDEQREWDRLNYWRLAA